MPPGGRSGESVAELKKIFGKKRGAYGVISGIERGALMEVSSREK